MGKLVEMVVWVQESSLRYLDSCRALTNDQDTKPNHFISQWHLNSLPQYHSRRLSMGSNLWVRVPICRYLHLQKPQTCILGFLESG